MKSQFRHYYKVLSFARKMRKNPTKADQAFWNRARRKNLYGLKYNRQF